MPRVSGTRRGASQFKSLRFFKLGKEDVEFLIEVPGDDEDWEQEMPRTYSISSGTLT